MDSKNRVIVLDYVRALALIMIFLNHAMSTFYIDQLNPELFNEISFKSQMFMVNGYIISRLGVPLFLFLTGALVLSKNFTSKEDIKTFYKKNLLSLVISVIIWNIIYYFINMSITNSVFKWDDLLLTILFLRKSVYGHMWYMPMIIGMYLFLPYISLIVKKYDIKVLKVPVIISLIVFFVIPYLNIIFAQLDNPFNLSVTLNLNFSGAQYGLYIILGYYIYNSNLFSKISYKLKYILICLGYFASVFLQVYLYRLNVNSIVYYNFIGVLLFSALIFSIMIKRNYRESKIMEYISRNSLGIFFIHFPVLILLNNYITINASRPVLVIIFYIMAFIVSIIIIEILKLFKITRVYLLRYK